jgi:hypothetical protein
LSGSEEIDTFVVINSEQKKVDVNLVLLLKSDMDYPIESPYYLDKIAVDVVKKLNVNSCLANKIYMGYAEQEKRTTWVTLNTLVRAIKQNRFIRLGANGGIFQKNCQDVEGPYKKIRDLFTKMKQCDFPYFLESTDRFFLTNRGLRILFRFVFLFQRNVETHRISIDLNRAIEVLARMIDKELKEKLENFYGEGGAKKAVDKLVETLKDNPDFRRFESDLRRLWT